MQATITTATSTATSTAISAGRSWAGRVLSGLAGAFLLFDAVGKLLLPDAVREGTAALGFPIATAPIMGIIMLVCLAVYAFPRTAVAGAILLTGYFGGVIATHLRAGSSSDAFIFVLALAAFVWGGLALRDRRVMAIIGAER